MKNELFKSIECSVIGAGLAGVEAANVLAREGFSVRLIEMKPVKKSPAHSYDGFAELVCSNSLKAKRIDSAAGMLKEEMRRLGSITVEAALRTATPAGGALAVDRVLFSDLITKQIKENKNITVEHRELTLFPESNAIICTGPLTSDAFAARIEQRCGVGFLSFYDAAAPIISAESINADKVYFATRYDKGEADYINCPFEKEEYERFYNALVQAQTAPLREFETLKVFEGCMPIEVLAKRGAESLRYGCMKPVGLINPKTSKRPYAVVQLRVENNAKTLYNLVGFQTNLKFSEQERVFKLIPGLENAEFVRYGVMHRNTFINSPKLLDETFMLNGADNIFFAGQITGVEGYMESAASGIIAGMSLARKLKGVAPLKLPPTSMIGALSAYISDKNRYSDDFQPMGANMGLLPPLDEKIKNKQERYMRLAVRGITAIDS
ncbi:MAG: methylenetetrahydrofolate--tRNA-(uracil(54)-C(5))-methyltransferase (FADH(2)-oxidizing) TrmFO [Oscillospiraceae bacterium]|nr:methylenetetrahydrofolate--tRNA-(uracil(54)-C(5))-methyltransferase (FADH(2)-oxidizing) TrmFO [Oscillospiraceae bacterium]